MISILNGTLIEATAGTAVIDVNGIGFELGISATTASSLAQVGSPTRLYTRMVVREDSCTLFGFATKDERTMFDKLVSVSGVGAKLALAILSSFTVPELYTLVMMEDDKRMATVPGVGKKTAQRLILELKGVSRRIVHSPVRLPPPCRCRLPPPRPRLLRRLRMPRRPCSPWASPPRRSRWHSMGMMARICASRSSWLWRSGGWEWNRDVGSRRVD